MADDFEFKTKADWDSGFKNNMVVGGEAPFVDADKIAIAPAFFDAFIGGRKAGWTEDKGGTSTLVDTPGTPDYVLVTQQYRNRFAHIQRPPPSAVLPPNSNVLRIHGLLKAINASDGGYWEPCVACYWDVDNWARLRLDTATNVIHLEVNIAGTIYTGGWGMPPFPISLNTWYGCYLILTKQSGQYFVDAYCYVYPSGSWFYMGGSVTIPSWNFDPSLLIFGSGVSDNPAWPLADFDNNGGSTSGPIASHLGMYGVYPLQAQNGSWQSPAISGHVSPGKILKEIILEQDYGTANNYINKVNILRASDDVVLSTWIGNQSGDFTLYASDFDNGFDVTLGVPFKIEVWAWSEYRGSWSEIDRLAGNFQFKWIAQETLGLSDAESANYEWGAKEELGLADKDIANSQWKAAETLGISDEAFTTAKASFKESLGLSDSESQEITIKFFETLGLHDNDPMTIATTLSETLGLSDDLFQLSEVVVGITAIIAPLLDISDFDFCATIDESGHVVYKVGPPDEGFQAYFFRKQTGQRFDIDLAIEPGDAVMFFCPSLTAPSISVGDTLRHNSIEYEVIAIRQKLHGSNKIYYKAACRWIREGSGSAIPDITGLAAGVNDDGSVLVSWSPVDTVTYPMFDHYELYISDDDITYELVRETSSPSATIQNLTPGQTYYFKVRGVSGYGTYGNYAGPVNTGLPSISLPKVPLVTVGDNKDGSVLITWGEISKVDYPTFDRYQLWRSGGSHLINGVNQGSKYFEFAGAWEQLFYVGQQITITGSTGNDGTYTVANYGNVGTNTRVVVAETIPDPTPDGSLAIADELLTETTTTSFTARNLRPNVFYYFKMRAVDIYERKGDSTSGYACGYGSGGSGVPQVLNPAATSPSAGNARVTWNEVESSVYSAFDYYEVWMKKGASGTWQLLTETTGVTHTQQNLAADTYYFQIRAISIERQQGTFSSTVSATVT